MGTRPTVGINDIRGAIEAAQRLKGNAPPSGRKIAGNTGPLLARVWGANGGKVSAARSKFGAIRTKVDGINFPSKREANRYKQLRLLEAAGRIKGLARQRTYKLIVDRILICSYRSDFEYEELINGIIWSHVTEDCKGYKTPEYRMKAKLMQACHGIEIRET